MNSSSEASQMLKARMEGKLYSYISVSYFQGTAYCSKWFYTVKNGVVYEIESDGVLSPSADSLLDLYGSAKMVGKYKPEKNYMPKTKVFEYKEILKMLKLK